MRRLCIASRNFIIAALLLAFLLGVCMGWCIWEWMRLVMMVA